MLKTKSDEAEERTIAATAHDVYEPPALTPLGNARELLAGETGTYTDANPDPLNPQDGQETM